MQHFSSKLQVSKTQILGIPHYSGEEFILKNNSKLTQHCKAIILQFKKKFKF